MFSCFKKTSKCSYNVSTLTDPVPDPPPRRHTHQPRKLLQLNPPQNGKIPSTPPVVNQPEKKMSAPPIPFVGTPQLKAKPEDGNPKDTENHFLKVEVKTSVPPIPIEVTPQQNVKREDEKPKVAENHLVKTSAPPIPIEAMPQQNPKPEDENAKGTKNHLVKVEVKTSAPPIPIEATPQQNVKLEDEKPKVAENHLVKTSAPPIPIEATSVQNRKSEDEKPKVEENHLDEIEQPQPPPIANETVSLKQKSPERNEPIATENHNHFDQKEAQQTKPEEVVAVPPQEIIENIVAVHKNQQPREETNEIAMSQNPVSNHKPDEATVERKVEQPDENEIKNETPPTSPTTVLHNGDSGDDDSKPRETAGRSARYRPSKKPDDDPIVVQEIEVKKTVKIEEPSDDSESEPEEASKPTTKANPKPSPEPESNANNTPEERRGGVRQTAKIDTAQEIKEYPKSEEEISQIKRAILANEFLENVLKGETLTDIIGAMYIREVEAGEVIIEEGEDGDHMYVSAAGKYEVYIQNKLENIITGNRVFGELAILYNAKRMAKIKAATKGQVWVLPREVYKQTLVKNAIKDQEETLSFLQNVPLINTLKKEKLFKIANMLRKEFFKTDSVIIREGDRGDKFYIIRAGSVTVTKNDEGKVAELGRGSFFGERALRQEDRRQATVIADAPGVECLTLTRAQFQEHFDDSIWKNDDASRKESTKKSRPKIELKPTTEFGDVNLSDLKRVETLGVGGFGRVELVQHKENPKLTFALKYLKKIDMVQQGQVDHVFSEKEIQISCESVFIVRMYKTFKDHKYLYFLMESCLGGDLWTYLQKQKDRHVNESSGRFYAACVLESLSYLHDRDCVYRDLKPENLLLDVNGYLKLTDFGFAKHIGPRGKTYTFAGTPEYVAPEIVYNRGHDKSVDYWAFGIFIFELLVGKTPFRSDDPSHMKTYNRILRGISGVTFPQHVSRTANGIIQKLCKAAPTERLGAQKNGVQDIRNHKWFNGFDWNKLRSQKIKAPYIPRLNSNVDTKYFEKFKKDDDIPPDEISGFDSTF